MFILQTCTALIITSLIVVAYNALQEHLINTLRSRTSRLGARTVSDLPTVEHTSPNSADDGSVLEADLSHNKIVEAETERNKQFYHKLHNLEFHRDILPECRELLVSLLSSTISDALATPEASILSIPNLSHDKLSRFLSAKDADVTDRWEAYLQRRKAGEPREVFSDKQEAKWWLKQAAPVKYVDGAWLGHINKITTPFKLRGITKNAWQVMSEELGDGDLEKNHVFVYRNLMRDINAGLPDADTLDFIHPRHGLNEARVWKAAVAQLLISLFPHDFLPEALGFNMAYESLPLHLLKTIKELREVGLNPYYFELHVSIDNADSGHAAMAAATVEKYLEIIKRDEGLNAARIAWKRVQAGYILAEGLPTTPESPSLKVPASCAKPIDDSSDTGVLEIFAAKSAVAHKIHSNSRLKIGRRRLVDWLEPTAFRGTQWQKDFLQDLSNSSPWVIKGNSGKSRLVQYLSWGGKMFGSFTQTEVIILKTWIDGLRSPGAPLGSDTRAYYNFTGMPSELPTRIPDILVHYPVFDHDPTSIPGITELKSTDSWPSFSLSSIDLPSFLALWFASPALLESLPSVPVRATDEGGSSLIRVIRAQNGFDDEGSGVAGMDEVRRTDSGKAIGLVELGLEMCRRAGLPVPPTLKEAVSMGDEKAQAAATSMVEKGMRWLEEKDILIGMTWAWMEVHEWIAVMDGDEALLDDKRRGTLRKIASRERDALSLCKDHANESKQRRRAFQNGLALARSDVEHCCRY